MQAKSQPIARRICQALLDSEILLSGLDAALAQVLAHHVAFPFVFLLHFHLTFAVACPPR